MEWISLGCRHALLIQQENLTAQTPWLCIIFNSALNKSFSEWSEVFPNASCVVAMIDRLIHHAEILAIKGESYRRKEAQEQAAARSRKRTAKAAT
ncbi:ATP-binding protein [Candidatus Accumulibacter sp. ACC005]|uniref:ATP-binding protein n=1 Tax=Candidatus Accumulibacter sp. ACC005 TaxID=2823331 RepID=UPI0025BF46D0|nr:ATP-binding protein [Candidatus Accumulibacter sp. ACC005]